MPSYFMQYIHKYPKKRRESIYIYIYIIELHINSTPTEGLILGKRNKRFFI